MSGELIPFGNFKIHVPIPSEGQQLLFQDGVELSQGITRDFLESLAKNRTKLIILIPDELDARSSLGEARVMAEFFVGLLEPSLKFIRDKYFPDLEVARKRSLITAVSDEEDVDLEDLVNYIFRGSDVYEELESFIKDRISLAFLHSNDDITIMQISEEGFVNDVRNNRRLTRNAMGFLDKFDKAFDSMFMSNMTCGESMMQKKSEELQSKPPQIDI